MTFKEWMVGRQPTKIAADAGLTVPTIYRAMAGLRVSYDSAKALHELTGGEISLAQFCEGDQIDETA
jgi:hypothetical protein